MSSDHSRRDNASMRSRQTPVLVGIDFGTAFSSVIFTRESRTSGLSDAKILLEGSQPGRFGIRNSD